MSRHRLPKGIISKQLPVKTFFDEVPCYISVQDRDFRIVRANNQFKKDFGDREGAYCYEIYKHAKEKCPYCPVEMTFKDGQVHNTQETVRSIRGDDIHVITRTTPIYDDDGNIEYVMEMSTDITENVNLERQLEESRRLYNTLFDEVPCYISIQDRDLRIVEANRRFKNDFGDVQKGFCYEVYKHRTEQCMDCPVVLTFMDGQVHGSEEILRTKSGDLINVLVYTAPIRNTEGKIDYVMEMSTEITDIRRLQSQLTSSGQLLGSISHSIKGVMTGLEGGIYIVNSGLKKNNQKTIQKGWGMVEKNVDRISNMVRNILYYTKERDLKWENIDLGEIARDVCTHFSMKMEESSIKFDCNFCEYAGTVHGDPDLLHSTFVNILENAVYACSADRRKTDHFIRWTIKDDGQYIISQFTDNGIGMDEESKDKMFTLFFSSKGAKGTGLGMFIANHVIDKHGGKILVDSSPQNGTTITIQLPKSH